MNPKIQKFRTELEKNKGKITDLQSRNRDLEKRIRELENAEIVGIIRAEGMTPEELSEFIRLAKSDKAAADAEEEVLCDE